MSELHKPVRHHRSREEAARLVMEYKQSGLGPTAFCRIHGISVSTLDNYRKRFASVAEIGAADQDSAGAALSKTFQSSSDAVASAASEPVVIAKSSLSTDAQSTTIRAIGSSQSASSRHAAVSYDRKPLSPSSAVQFVPVDVIDPPAVATRASPREIGDHDETNRHDATLIIELHHGRRIGVMNGFDAATLLRLIAVLEEAS